MSYFLTVTVHMLFTKNNNKLRHEFDMLLRHVAGVDGA